ncbi:MAG: hypothetical protein L3J34_04900 [Flavobacteriaceae bacterium]|nr:hypothetical protein [Flavobacteriaceae bacterium]
MRKLLLVTIVLLGFGIINAQEKVKEGIKKGADAVETEAVKLYNQAKTGGFKAGANIGLPIQGASDVSSFNFGADIAYLFEIMENLEVGGLVGYTVYNGDGKYEVYDGGEGVVVKNYKDAGFVPISTTARYYFSNRKFFGGLDLGYAINVSGDANGGLFVRPKFGFNFGKITLIGSFQRISGGVDYYEGNVNVFKISGFTSANFGIEYGF